MDTFRDLTVYKKAFIVSMEIFEMTKTFPKDEKCTLTSQLRRSFRSVCRSIGEGYRKRQYSRHFVSKISDADMENTEAQVSLEFVCECGYISTELKLKLLNESSVFGRLPIHMMQNPEKYKSKNA